MVTVAAESRTIAEARSAVFDRIGSAVSGSLQFPAHTPSFSPCLQQFARLNPEL